MLTEVTPLATITFAIVATRGDTLELECSVTDLAGDPFDLTGWTPQSQLRFDRDDEDPTAEFQVTDLAPAAGTFTLRLDPADTVNLDTTYVCDVQLVGGVDTHTWADGTIDFTQDVTR